MNEFFGLLYKECPHTFERYGRNQHKLTKNRGFSENLSYKSKIFRGFLEMLCGCMDISRFHRKKRVKKQRRDDRSRHEEAFTQENGPERERCPHSSCRGTGRFCCSIRRCCRWWGQCPRKRSGFRPDTPCERFPTHEGGAKTVPSRSRGLTS